MIPNTPPGSVLPECGALVVILLLAAGLRFHHLGQAPLWYDEQTQYAVARESTVSGIWRAGLRNGPLGAADYLANAASLRLVGETRTGLRAAQACFGVLAVLATFLLARRWLDVRAALVAAALLSVHGVHIQFSREARPYALLTLTAVLVALAFDGLVRSRSKLAFSALAGAALLLLLVHPCGVFVCAGLGLGALAAVVCRAKPSPETRWAPAAAWSAVAMSGGAFLAYALWWHWQAPVPLAHDKASESFIADTLHVYKALIGGYWGASAYAVMLACFAGCVAGLKCTAWRWPVLLSLAIGLLAVVPALLCYRSGIMINTRYSLFAMPFVCILSAAGIEQCCRVAGSTLCGRLTFRQAMLAPALALLLLGLALVQHRSPYDLETWKATNPTLPTLEIP